MNGKKRPLCWLPLTAEVLCLLAFLLLDWIVPLHDPAAGIDRATILGGWLLLAVTILGAVNLVYPVYLGFQGEGRLLRKLGFWGKLALTALLAVSLGILALSLMAVTLFLCMFTGPLGLLGTGAFGAIGLAWLYFIGLGPSAYLAAFLWSGVRAGKVTVPRAVVHTLLQLIPVADVIAAVWLYITTRRGKAPRAAGDDGNT